MYIGLNLAGFVRPLPSAAGSLPMSYASYLGNFSCQQQPVRSMPAKAQCFIAPNAERPLQSVFLLARAQAAAVATWVRAVSSRDFSASRRTCRSGRKCFSFSRLLRYSSDSFSSTKAASECGGRRRRHSAARRSWLSMSEKSWGLMLEQCFRSGRRRSSAERRFSFTCRKVASASGGIIPSSPRAHDRTRGRRRRKQPCRPRA